jgi:hypothetical protein
VAGGVLEIEMFADCTRSTQAPKPDAVARFKDRPEMFDAPFVSDGAGQDCGVVAAGAFVTSTAIVQAPLAPATPLASEMTDPDAFTVPVQLFATFGDAATTSPDGSVSVKARPFCTLVLVFDSVNVRRVVPPIASDVGVNVLLSVTLAGTVTVLVSSVMAAFFAMSLPINVAPPFMVMLVNARTFPTSDELTPSVAELPTCQNTLPGTPPLIITTDEPVPVVIVVPILKMKTALGLP